MTFKDLKKRVTLETTYAQSISPLTTSQQQSWLFERLQNKPFWIWDIQEHKQEDIRKNGACFNHIIGLPQKDSVDKPLYDYENITFDSLVTHNGNKQITIGVYPTNMNEV